MSVYLRLLQMLGELEIVPLNDELKRIAKVKPNEIAFANIGDPACVANGAIDTEGNILFEIFEIEVKIYKNYLGMAQKSLPVASSMVADIDIITGKRTRLNHFMKSFNKGFERALRER